MAEENSEQPLNADDRLDDWGEYDPKLDLSGYEYPPLDLLPESLRPFMQEIREQAGQFMLPLLLSGEKTPIIQELYHHPNVLLAGTIASGKTQFIYNQLICWLYAKHPAEIKFVICRSKRIDYNSIAKVERHFLAKLPGESPMAEGRQVPSTIHALVIECDMRLGLFREAGVKNIQDYNTKFVSRRLNPEMGHRYLPDIVLIMDDLSTFLYGDTSAALARLTQQNLYTGIYLIAVTSQIMARNISPQLRANFSVRLAMKLMSQNESRKILDRVGAEKLSQPSELLYEAGDKVRKGMQPFIDYKNIIDIGYFIGGQRGYPSAFLLPEYIDADSFSNEDFDINERDPMFEDAARLVVLHQQGSTSLIQRKLKLDYNRAGRIIDQLEAAGIVGPFEGSRAREVLYPDEYALEQFLEGLYMAKGNTYLKQSNTPMEKKPIVPQVDKNVKRQAIHLTSVKKSTNKPPFSKTRLSTQQTNTNPQNTATQTNTALFAWLIVLILAIIVYLVGGWDALVDWLR